MHNSNDWLYCLRIAGDGSVIVRVFDGWSWLLSSEAACMYRIVLGVRSATKRGCKVIFLEIVISSKPISMMFE